MIIRRSLLVCGLGTCLLTAGFAAHAQDIAPLPGSQPAPAPAPPPTRTAPADNAVTGPPSPGDFQLPGSRRIVTQRPEAAPPPVVIAPPPPAGVQPRTTTPRPEVSARPAAPAQAPTAPASAPIAPSGSVAPPPALPTEAAPAPETPAVAAPVAERDPDAAPLSSYWPYAIPVVLLALFGLALRRRRRADAAYAYAVEEQAPVAATPVVRAPGVTTAAVPPRPAEPPARPWLELEFKTERASFTATEAIVQFELAVVNNGDCAARNLRIDVKMFNAGREQDQEIGSFFRTAGRQTTRLNLPGIAAKNTGLIPAQVAMPRDDMRAVQLEDRVLFVPVVAVNVLYEWGEGLMGQTSKSYVIGRELQQPSEKMGAFRVDQGPRIWRTVGQRQHNLERRV